MLSEPLLMRSVVEWSGGSKALRYNLQGVVRPYGALCMFRKGGRNDFLSPEEGTGEPLPRDPEC